MRNQLKRLYAKYFGTDEASLYLLGTLGILALLLLTNIMSLFAPFVAAFVIAYLLQGAVSFITKHLPAPNLVVTMCVFVLFLVVFIGLVLLIVPLLYQQTIAFFASLPQLVPQWLELLQAHIAYIPGLDSFINLGLIENHIVTLIDSSMHMLVTYSVGNVDSLVLFLTYLVIVPTLVFFMLKDKSLLLTACRRLLPQQEHMRTQFMTMLCEMDAQIMNYIRGKLFEGVVVGLATYAICAWFGLQYAELLSFVVGLSVFIPYVGIVVVTIPLILVAVSQFGFGVDLYWLLGLYTLLHLLDANLLVPILFSEAVKIHPILILLVIVLSAGIWGVWGVFFAIPLAVCIKALVSNWPFGTQAT